MRGDGLVASRRVQTAGWNDGKRSRADWTDDGTDETLEMLST